MLSQQGSYPYGEQWYQSGPGNKWFFTNYNRDSETGLDYALARYYDSRTGTFCSADPQSWNTYPYGRNNPIHRPQNSASIVVKCPKPSKTT